MQRRQQGIGQILEQRHLLFALHARRLGNFRTRRLDAHGLVDIQFTARFFDHFLALDHRLFADAAAVKQTDLGPLLLMYLFLFMCNTSVRKLLDTGSESACYGLAHWCPHRWARHYEHPTGVSMRELHPFSAQAD